MIGQLIQFHGCPIFPFREKGLLNGIPIIFICVKFICGISHLKPLSAILL
nr:MAG TPA: hypothetical protein [Caudoviricetes sp.]